MRYKIKSAEKNGTFEGKFGTTQKWILILEDAEGSIVSAELNQKPETPAPSGEIEGTIEETQFGRRFKKSQAMGGGYRSTGRTPEERDAIEWQSARRDALEFITAKSRLLLDLGKKTEAEKELSGDHWLQVTQYAKKFASSVPVQKEEEKPATGKSDGKLEPSSEEVDESAFDDIPFST